ncbi:MAG: hypothetical protein DRN20_01500 [Thermoplasmata archaeon]|nr:MAG: hypothetical protein DRN20_01500 [Thermoplasmata archaeon]
MIAMYSIYTECPQCGESTKHKILRGNVGKKGDVFTGTVQCTRCGFVQKISVNLGSTVRVPVIISWMGESRRESVEFFEEEVIRAGDEFMVGDVPVIVTSIELEGQKRVKAAPASQIKTIWAKRFDKVRVKFSISRGSRTVSKNIFAVPDEEFAVGDLLDIDGIPVVIHKIKVAHGHRDRARARDIVRVYAKSVKNL